MTRGETEMGVDISLESNISKVDYKSLFAEGVCDGDSNECMKEGYRRLESTGGRDLSGKNPSRSGKRRKHGK